MKKSYECPEKTSLQKDNIDFVFAITKLSMNEVKRSVF